MIAATPHRPDGVDDELRGQPVPFRDLRLTCLAAAEQAALVNKLGSGSAVDRTIHTAAAEQRGVRGVDDRVDFKSGDVGLQDSKIHDVLLESGANTGICFSERMLISRQRLDVQVTPPQGEAGLMDCLTKGSGSLREK